jgi:mRNA-degrading endonuclease RelE of RelBE toxin-antitoxin system
VTSVAFSLQFKHDLKALGKRYRSIRADVTPLIEQLQSGALPGDQIPGLDYTVFKVRVPNRDAVKGKRGGYRVIYYLKAKAEIILITIYSKTERANFSSREIRAIIEEAAP